MKLISAIFRRTDWYVTSPFGMRRHPVTGAQAMHYGTDYGTNVQKWPLYAIEDGYVHVASKSAGAGNYVWVRYPRINKSLFLCHMDSIVVKQGQAVKEGTLLGYTGTTGQSTGVHLHLGMTDIGKDNYQDPHAYEYDGGAGLPDEKLAGFKIEQIRKGSKGDSVVLWQQILLREGYSLGSWGADGDFGGMTDSATRLYQRSKGLVVDGIVGKASWISAGYVLGEYAGEGDEEAPEEESPKGILYGIDVSGWQKDSVCDTAEYDFAIVKATEGTTFTSSAYKRQMDGAIKRGKLLGVYHFASGLSAIAEAAYFVQAFAPYRGMAIPVLDYEAGATSKGREWVRQFMNEFKRITGVMPWLYTYYSVAQSQNLKGLCDELGAGFWLAQYWLPTERRGYDLLGKDPAMPCDCWQYTSEGYITGYPDRLDCNVFYGSVEDWKSYY